MRHRRTSPARPSIDPALRPNRPDVSLAAFAVLAVLAAVSLLARKTVASPLLGRLRALFPSWRFFDRAVLSPRLLVRIVDGEVARPWIAVDGGVAVDAGDKVAASHEVAASDAHLVMPCAATPGWLRWAFAPADNLALAYHAVVVQLVAELGELELAGDDLPEDAPLAIETDPQVTKRVAYELVTRVARAHVAAGARFQWKIVVPGEPAPIDYLLSPVLA
ncbi:MAG: hypothetical protein H7138_15155 [Myxococcales bacterium]|nr:hypothetical protein [Myxococcales bacterium]